MAIPSALFYSLILHYGLLGSFSQGKAVHVPIRMASNHFDAIQSMQAANEVSQTNVSLTATERSSSTLHGHQRRGLSCPPASTSCPSALHCATCTSSGSVVSQKCLSCARGHT